MTENAVGRDRLKGEQESGDNGGEEERRDARIASRSSTNPVVRAIYVTGYVLNGIRRHKKRSLSLLLGVMIGVALVASILVWTDTGARVAVEDYFEDNAFHYYVVQRSHFPWDDPQAIYPVRDWVNKQPSTKVSFVVYRSVALLEIGDRKPSEVYLPWPYSRGIKDCSAFFVDNDFLEVVEQTFTYEGSFRITKGSVLVSRKVVEDAKKILGIDIGIGSTINIAVARNYRYVTYIGDINPIFINGLRVVGIYDIEPSLEALQEAFPTLARVNYAFQGREVVFGWFDGIILHRDLLSSQDQDMIAVRVMYPRLLVQLDPAAIYAQGGLERVVDTIDSLFNRIESKFDVFVGGRSRVIDLYQYIEAYKARRTMGVLVAPIIILSILLTAFATSLFLSGRRAEVAILRARGASYRQLFATFLLEFLILGVIGLVLGSMVSIVVGCLIPAATGFLQFDMAEFLRFFALVQFHPTTWIVAGLACLLPASIYTFFAVHSFLRAELYQEMRGAGPVKPPSLKKTFAYLLLASALFLPFVFVVLTVPLSTDAALSLFAASAALWVVLCDAGARVLRPGVAGLSRLLHPLFGQKSLLFSRSIRVRRSRILPLLLILTLTFSVTIYSAVEAQTYKANLDRQIEYYLGSDIRIFSGLVPATRVEELRAIPGIEAATAVIKVAAKIGTTSFKLLGVDPLAYAKAGKWDSTSMVDADAQEVLQALAENPSAIILPRHIAEKINRHVGSKVNVSVWDQKDVFLEYKVFDVVGEVYSAPGFGYANPSEPAASVSPVPGFGFQFDRAYAFCHINYFLVEVPSWKELHYVNKTQLFLASVSPDADFNQVYEEVQRLDFAHTVWSPRTFDLEEAYPDAYLFSRGVISLLSVGFMASLVISMVALTIFVGTIVAERKTEYAIMRALGGTRQQVTAIVLGEFTGLILAAFLLSLVLGAGFSWLLMYALLKLFPMPSVVPFTVIWPITLLLVVLGLVVAGMLAGTYIPARRAGAIQVSRILRNL